MRDIHEFNNVYNRMYLVPKSNKDQKTVIWNIFEEHIYWGLSKEKIQNDLLGFS